MPAYAAPRLVAASLLFCASVWASVDVNGDRVCIDTPHGRVTVRRGVIVGLENKLTGERYTAAKADGELTGLRWLKSAKLIDADAQVVAAKQGPNRAQIKATLPDGSSLGMTFEVDEATQDILVRQNAATSRKGLYGVQWGVAGIDARQTQCLVPGCSGMALTAATPQDELGFTWPTGWEVQMMVVAGAKGGCWVWSQDEQMHFKVLRWQRKRGLVTLRFESLNFAPLDDLTSANSVEWRLAFFKGDWRVPAKRYRDWAHKAWGLTRLADQQPAWVKDVRFVVIMGMDKDVLDELKKHVRPSATLLYIPNWRRDGYDKNYPDYTAHDGFEPFVHYARSLGYHVMPHMNYFGCDPKHEAYERFKQWHMCSASSKAPLWWVPPRWRHRKDEEPPIKFAYISPASRAWRDELTQRMAEAQKRYGFDAIHLDQTLGIMNDLNGRVDGLTCAEGNVALHKQLRDAMPNVALSGEGLDEVTCRYEAFAQRHASYAVNHVFGTWDDGFIACGHPISSYFLTPYTKIYGYLGQCNPINRGMFMAWRRAYENWGVLPTYSRPTVAQIAQPSGEVLSLLAEARLWVGDKLDPDFEGKWSADAKFRLKGAAGVAAAYERLEGGGSRLVRLAEGRRDAIYTAIKGRNVVVGKGTIPGWFAFDEERLFGLDPDGTYTYLDEARDHRVPHVLNAADPVLVRVPMSDDKKFMVELEELSSTSMYDFAVRIDEAATGIVVAGEVSELAHGGSFRALMCQCSFVLKKGIFAHPPWRVAQDKGDEPVRAFGRYRVALPARHKATLEFSVGLRDGVDERSDGVQFRVEVDGEAVFDEVWKESKWKAASVPLDRWAGREVDITFITTPGPARNISFDWACWGEPHIRFAAAAKRTEIVLASPRPVRAVVGSDPQMTWADAGLQRGLHVYRAQLTMPGRIALLWAAAQPAELPLDLAKATFDISVAVENSPAKLPIPHVGAGPGEGSSGGVKRKGLNAHPPNRGRTSVDYLLRLPDKRPITLEFAAGLRDGSKSESVIFIVEANATEVYRERITGPDGWHPAKVDLSAFAGKALLLSLVVDADGPYSYDWATWADPVLK